jgi:metal-sulfur cluster biosynthetic enzyme
MSEDTPQAAPNEIRWELHNTHPDLVPALRAKLAEVVDPEIMLNVIQLGLIRKVQIEAGQAKLYVILTTPFCPYGPAMIEMIKQKSQEGLAMPVAVEMGFEAWDFSMMEDPGALDWGLYT